jgi:hypothetical protein
MQPSVKEELKPFLVILWPSTKCLSVSSPHSHHSHKAASQHSLQSSFAVPAVNPNGEIVVELKCPIDFFEFLTHGWATYDPVERKPGFIYYHKCSSPSLFSQSLPDLVTKKVLYSFALDTYISAIQICPEHPVRVIYNDNRHVLALSFDHQPITWRTRGICSLDPTKKSWTPKTNNSADLLGGFSSSPKPWWYPCMAHQWRCATLMNKHLHCWWDFSGLKER